MRPDDEARTSETPVNFYRLHGATTQKTVIFILAVLAESIKGNNS
jgi:hypothetical protein